MRDLSPSRWLPDFAIGTTVLALAVVENLRDEYAPHEWLLVGLTFAVAAGLARLAPGVALVLVWACCLVQLASGVPVLLVQLSVSVVAFGCARWGREATVVASGLSIPVAALIVLAIEASGVSQLSFTVATLHEFSASAYRFSDRLVVGALIIGLLFLAVPWLTGLALRALARARRSELRQGEAEEDAAKAQRETEQAREIARLRDEQATLATDVHDVVGHSLAVILAQAESGQFLPDDDPDALKRTLATIATSARSSLQDVRRVLSGTPDQVPARSGAFEELLEGVRAGGHDVVVSEVGTPQPLPPELEVVAHRVVQEMLTNAIRHGRRDRPVRVERHWPEGSWDRDLRIEVRNVDQYTSDETQPLHVAHPPGQGLEGMRRRLDAVGGRLDVRRRQEAGEPTFTTTPGCR